MKLSEIKISLEDLVQFCATYDEAQKTHTGQDLFEALYMDLFEHELSDRDKEIFR